MKKALFFALIALAGFVNAAEVATGEGQSGDKVYACTKAKEDAQRQARNSKMKVKQFSQCSCSEQKAYSTWYCTVDFVMDKDN